MVNAINGGGKGLWQRIRALVIFLIKLFIDGFRDVILFPVALVVFCLDFIVPSTGGKTLFDKLMAFGRGTDKAINLFNQHDIEDSGPPTVDDIFDRLELGLRQEYKSGKVSTQAKEVLDNTLARIRIGVNRNEPNSKNNQNDQANSENEENN